MSPGEPPLRDTSVMVKGLPLLAPTTFRPPVLSRRSQFVPLVPVASLDGRTIGTGKPGAVTLQLTGEFRKLTRAEGTTF